MAVSEKNNGIADYKASNIKWIKSINNNYGDAYLDVGEEFYLHHKDGEGLRKISEGELVLLYQTVNGDLSYTHLIEAISGEKVIRHKGENLEYKRKVRTVCLVAKDAPLRRKDTIFPKLNLKKLSFPNVVRLDTIVPSDDLLDFQNDIFAKIPWYEKRLFRITWNTNGWVYPSGHKWSKEKQGNSTVAHENQYGYGNEEWLLNPLNQLNGYQYGYFAGANIADADLINEAFLFTFEPKTNDRYLVGKVKDVEIIYGDKFEKELKVLARKFQKHKDTFIKDLEEANASTIKIKKETAFYFNIRFKIGNHDFYEELKLTEGLRGRQWNRFQPYIIDGALQEVLEGAIVPKEFVFQPGKAKSSNSHQKRTRSKSSTVNKHHSDISEDLIKYLQPDFSIKDKNLSVDRTYFGNHPADAVLKHGKDLFSILEIKTSPNARKNIREALGQLLDYALWDEQVKIKDLIIIAPTPLNNLEMALFKRLKKNLKLNLRYWQYEKDGKLINDRFIEIS